MAISITFKNFGKNPKGHPWDKKIQLKKTWSKMA